MKEILKPLITFFLEICAIGIYLDSGIDSLIARLHKLELSIEAEELIIAYNSTLQQELLQSIIAILSLFLIFIIHYDKVLNIISKCFIFIIIYMQKLKTFFTKTIKN